MAGLLDFLQGASNSAAANVSAPIDGLNWLLRKMGAPVSEKPFLGSDWMADKGLTAVPKNRNMGLLGEAVGGVLPMVAAAKAPQIAQGLLQAERNLAAPRTLNPQTGAILWHGSPHKFDAFDASKIGTGEGAQAYGHGLYLADSDEVAKQYQKSILPAIKVLDGNGESIVSDSAKSANAMHQLMRYKDINKAKQQTIDKDTLAELLKLEKRGAVVKGGGAGDTGQLYKVDLPDEQIAKMLDWDKPLSQQPDAVKALQPLADRVPGLSDALQPFELGSTNGQAVNNYISRSLSPDKAAQMFRDAGIPGIRYLDGGSRGAGVGSSNYVVFPGNEGLLSILERNGQPIKKPFTYPQDKALATAQRNAAKPISEGGLGLPANNTAAQRAQAMGFDTSMPLYHGTGADIQAFDPRMAGKNDRGLWGRGQYLTTSPDTASSYALREGDGANVIPAYAAVKRPMQITTGSDLITRMPDGTDTKALIGYNLDGAKIKEIAKAAGHDGVFQVKPNGNIGDIVTYDPSAIRSRFAAFDPARRNEADLLGRADPNLLAAIAGTGLLGYGGYQYLNDK